MSGRRWRVGGSVFTVVVLLVGTLAAASSMTARSAEAVTTYTGVRRLVVDSTTDGTLIVRGGGTTVTVRRRSSWVMTEPRLADRRTGDTLTLTDDCLGEGAITIKINCLVAYEIKAPAPTQLTVTIGGRIDVSGVTGPLDLASPGPITVTGARGPVSTRTRR